MTGILRVDTIQNSNTSTIITQTNSTTITIGTTGQTVALASGASSSGFGATYNGAVNWDTTPKTTTVTAASGVGYFINTTSGAVTVNLPAATAGSIVALSDYAGTWATNNVTVNANGTEKIGGVASAPALLNTRGQAVTFVYVDSTQGWVNTGDATSVQGAAFITATGGTITTCGDYKIHTFTGPGTFTVTNAGSPGGSSTVDYLVIAGGGAGGGIMGAGGGAGGFRESKATGAPWTASPLATSTSLPVSATGYPITVGAGGAVTFCGGGYPSPGGNQGASSIFSTITSAGGGGRQTAPPAGNGAGGSGAGYNRYTGTGAVGNSPPVSPPQGNPGGNVPSSSNNQDNTGSGGGGAGAVGGNASSSPACGPGPINVFGGSGGNGVSTSISGSSVTYAGGGGGGTRHQPGGVNAPSAASGGTGGGGNGGYQGNPGTSGTTNRGGGGGGGAYNAPGVPATDIGGGAGGSGIVIIRYKFQ